MKSMYIEKMMRRATALMVMLVAGVSALLAQPKLYVEDFSISAGETKQVAVCLDNTGVTDANTLSMTIKVPTGMTIETKDVGFSKPVMDVTMNNQRAVGFSAIGNAANGYLSLTSTGNTIAEGDGAVFYIKVTAADNLPVTSQLELENAVLSCKSGTSYKSANGTLTVENATVTKLDDITLSFAQNPITMEPGGTYSMAVEMTNTGKEVTGFQADLVLPTGWTATIADGRLVNSGSGYRILSSSISGEEGTLFTINLVAPASFTSGSAEVKLQDIYATVGTSEEQLANITLKVNANGGAVSDKPVLTFVQNEVAIAAGKTGKVDVNLQNPGMDVKGFQADVVLPTGWTATVENGRLVNAGNDSRVLYSDFMNSIPGEDGVLFSLNVTTAADFTGEAEVKLQNIYVTVGFKEVALEDITVKVKSHDADAKAAADAIVAALQQKLDDMKAELGEEKLAELQGLIDGLKQEVETQYNAGTLDIAATQAKADAIAAQADHARAAAYIQNYVNDLTKDVEALVVPDEVKSYTNKEVQALVQAANQAIGQAGGTRAGVMSALSQVQYNPTSTYDQAVSTVEQVKSVMGPLIAAAQTAIEAAVAKYNEVKPLEDAQKTLAEEQLKKLQEDLATLVIPEEVAASVYPAAKEAVGAANQAIANANGAVNQGVTAVLNQYANNLTSEEGAAKLKEATEQAQAAIDAAKAAIEAAKEAHNAEALAEAAAQQALADAQGKASELMAEYQAIAGYNHPDFFGVRNQAAGMLQALSRGALQNLGNTVNYACNVYHNAATDNAENIAAAIEQFNTQYEAAKAAIEAAKAKKAELEAAEAAARETAQNDVKALQETAAGLVIPEELLNAEDPEIQAAVAQAGQAIDAANGTVNAVASILNDPSVYLSSEAGAQRFADAKTAAEAAIEAAKAAIEAAIDKDDALKAELAAQAVVQETLDGLTEDLQKLMDDYNKLLSYGNPAIDELVHGTDETMTDANEKYAAASDVVAQAIEEGNVATDNALAVKAALDATAESITAFGKALEDLNPQLAAIEQQAAAEAQAYSAEAMGRLQQLMGKMNGLYYGHPDYQETYNALYALRGAAAGLMNPLMMGTQTAVGNGTVSTENYQNLKQTRESMEAALVAFENGIAAAEALKAELEAAEAAAIEADNLAVDALETEVADAAAQITDEMRASNNAEVDAALTVADAAKDAAVEAIAAAQAVVDDANVWKSTEVGAQQFAEALEAAQAAVDAYEQAVEAVKAAYETATGISTVSVKKYDEGAWYTLNGQRVETPSKGVFIHNGKKVVIK